MTFKIKHFLMCKWLLHLNCLTFWEEKFITSISKKRDGDKLSKTQDYKIQEVYEMTRRYYR